MSGRLDVRRREMIFSEVNSIGFRYWVVIVLMLSAVGCSVGDDRDMCCGNVVVTYRYLPYGVDELSTYIDTMRHYVFDGEGRYVGEVGDGCSNRCQQFMLPDGDYTMVTLGNVRSDMGFDVGGCTLESLELELLEQTRSGAYDNSDEIYWGFCPMHIEGRGEHRFEMRMNNIHSHLHVKVVWYNMPSYVGDYRMELSGVPVGYSLTPSRAYGVDDKYMPSGNGALGVHALSVPLRAQELHGEFVTFRYDDDTIPTFRLWFGDEAITGEIDLGRAFGVWGWRPESTAVQEYRIQLTIYSDDTVEVKPWVETDVEDWEDGGSFG